MPPVTPVGMGDEPLYTRGYGGMSLSTPGYTTQGYTPGYTTQGYSTLPGIPRCTLLPGVPAVLHGAADHAGKRGPGLKVENS